MSSDSFLNAYYLAFNMVSKIRQDRRDRQAEHVEEDKKEEDNGDSENKPAT